MELHRREALARKTGKSDGREGGGKKESYSPRLVVARELPDKFKCREICRVLVSPGRKRKSSASVVRSGEDDPTPTSMPPSALSHLCIKIAAIQRDRDVLARVLMDFVADCSRLRHTQMHVEKSPVEISIMSLTLMFHSTILILVSTSWILFDSPVSPL